MKRGFTVVEMAVVIVVIAILASIIIIGYDTAQDDSRDTARRAAAQQIVQAVETLRTRTDSVLQFGGYQTSGPAPVGAMCAHNSVSNAFASNNANWVFYSGGTSSDYSCTLGSMLMGTKVLPLNFDTKLPENEDYTESPARKKDAAMVIYRCDTTNRRWVLYYYLKSPTTEEADAMTSLRNSCTQGPSLTALRDTLKMRAATEIKI
ncbi:hypothetical protein B7Z17_04390 [Candidatus Saccharibacteria bacterium 32-49-10]|nr:MAG: hypothetical protein B7Z17_04390 [Candidatus Saccharibacteria bacterium 32-49-10]